MANTGQSRSDRRVLRVLVIAGGAALATAVLNWAVGSPLEVIRALGPTGQAEFEILFANAAGLAAWLCLGWCCAVVGLEVVAAVPGSCGRAFGAIAATVTPGLVRRLAQGLIGLSVLAGPLSAGQAVAASPSGTTTSPATPLDRPTSAIGALEGLDLPAPTTSPAPVPTTSRAPVPTASLAPALTGTARGSLAAQTPSAPAHRIDLDRPSKPFVPATPAPAPKVAPMGPAELVAGVPHRENADPTYVVRRGDALWDVAARHLGPHATAADVAREWPRWYAANRLAIGADPNLIHPGEVLIPPVS